MAQPQRPAQPRESPDAIYQRRCADFGRQRDTYSRRSSRNANLSLALIAGALACLGGMALARHTGAAIRGWAASLRFRCRGNRPCSAGPSSPWPGPLPP